ncbi:glutathione S-transferase 1-like isoform X2 [Photinus pyralis]|uniref:glutathione S-transferase 1-like isoform X2 n=1 Tax=Photinus pyralis TaxID=7054 RepID=UPI0012674876|nr:glutathione S-transferase 1-like isoform X2 [Photinus pyralis]
MSPKLYVIDLSPPVRSVYLTAAALGITLEHVELDYFAGDHLKPEFIKINPQHTLPTLVDDDGTIVWDSHAINAYLVSKYGKDDSLYPKDFAKRALVDQRLHFDSGWAFLGMRNIEPIYFRGSKTIPEYLKENANKIYNFLETFLEGKMWVAGDNITIADFSLISSITSLNVLVPIDSGKFPKVAAWIQRSEQLPYYAVNKKGLEDFKTNIDNMLRA